MRARTSGAKQRKRSPTKGAVFRLEHEVVCGDSMVLPACRDAMPLPQRPEDLEVDVTDRFVSAHLGASRRVLDVGCGNGLLARRLRERGLDVTALDRSLKRAERFDGVTFVEADFLTFEDRPYDALLFSASLHHLFPLEEALQTTERLLRPGGLLLVSDFDLEAPDRETARWYYDVEGLLVASGLYRPDKVAGSAEDDPLERWHAEHVDTPPFHTGAAMSLAIARRFIDVGTSRGPYLYRYVVGGLEPSASGTRIAAWALATEERRLQQGVLKPVGVSWWARKPGAL